MRFRELIEQQDRMPHLYLDMDGVQADFFSSWAKWHAKKFDDPSVLRYKDIGDAMSRESSIVELSKEGPEAVEEFFATLPELPSYRKLLSWLRSNNIPFTVLSAPLRNEAQASIKGKRYWLDQHNPGTSDDAIFTSEKQRYAVTDGTPNVLVDDFKKYIKNWTDSGGIGVLHRDNDINATLKALEEIYAPYMNK